MAEPTESSWLVPFVVATATAALATGALISVVVSRRREARQVLAALQALAPDERDAATAARRAAAEASRQDAALAEMRATLEAAPFGIVALDRLGRVVALNPAASRMLGLSLQQCASRLLVELVRAPELDTLLEVAHETGRQADGELSFVSAGVRRTARAVAAPLANAVTDTACVVVLEDLTELRRLESVRSDFVANVSHELRTPVTNLRGYAETLLSSFQIEPQATSFLETIQRNATRLGAIIDDLLLLASLEGARAEPLIDATVPLAAVLAESVEQHADEAAAKGMRITQECPAALSVRGSHGLLVQAVGNLVANAVKYSPEHSEVQVRARLEGDQSVIEVLDRGPGIPAQHQARIFERFYRVDKARSRASGGTGLGLAIVKHVAQSHGGSVEVESRSGFGSTFRLRLPALNTVQASP